MFVYPHPDPVAISIGPLHVRWYGLMYLIGFVLFIVLGKLRARENLLTGWHPRDVDDMLLYGVEPHRVLYGTDWPIASMESYLEFMEELAIPERDKTKIFADNAIALFQLDVRNSPFRQRGKV